MSMDNEENISEIPEIVKLFFNNKKENNINFKILQSGFFNIIRIENFIKENNIDKNNYKEMWNMYEILYYGENIKIIENDKIFYYRCFE